MRKQKILIAEDDSDLVHLLVRRFKSFYECRAALTGETALRLLWTFDPSLLILDLSLPGFGGLDLLRLIREDPKSQILPVLVLTADTEESTMLRSFKAGADDFLRKPFNFIELAARVSALLRRSRKVSSGSQNLEIAEVALDLASHQASVRGRALDLTRTEFLLLEYLMQNPGKSLSKEFFIQAAWGMSEDIQTHTLDSHVANLRKKLGSSSHLIETIHGIGYRFKS